MKTYARPPLLAAKRRASHCPIKKGEKIMKTCKKMGRPTKRPEKELLMILYSRHTAHELATMYDVSDSTVRSWVCRLRKE